MRIIINECKKILDIRIILLLCMFSILYYMTFTQIYLYPTGGQVTNTKYDIFIQDSIMRFIRYYIQS